MDLLVFEDFVVLEEQQGCFLGRQVNLEFEGNEELMGCLGMGDLQVLLATLDQEDLLVLVALKEHVGSQGHQVHQVE